MFDYIVNYELWIDDLKFNKEEIITLDDFYNIDFRDSVIKDKLEELHLEDNYSYIEILEIKSLIDRNVQVDNMPNENWEYELK